MATLNVYFTPPTPAPMNGYLVEYRVKGTTGAYATATGTTSPIQITGLLAATEYEGTIKSDCGGGVYSTVASFNTCTCAAGYTSSTDNNRCQKIETTPATVTNSGYCLAASTNVAYGSYFTRIYNPVFNNDSISLFTAPSADVYAEMSSTPVWANTLGNEVDGPVNRSSVWIDSDCDGIPNALATGAQTTIAYAYENTTGQRTICVGVAADNQFILNVNGTAVAQTTNPSAQENFKIFHIFQVTLVDGFNDFNVVATGDGSINDAVVMVVFDNTPAEIAAVTDQAGYDTLTRLFDTQNLRGTTYEVATCPATYSLDTSGGTGNYICRRVTTIDCGGAAV